VNACAGGITDAFVARLKADLVFPKGYEIRRKTTEPGVQPQVVGVIAIGLPSKEELDIRHKGRDIFVANHQASPRHVIFETFDLISEMGLMKVSLIQSTRDDFLPAEAARALFGPDSNNRRFYAVEARNHRFSGGTKAFRHSLVESLSWISEPAATTRMTMSVTLAPRARIALKAA
jgi:hypothetical protein